MCVLGYALLPKTMRDAPPRMWAKSAFCAHKSTTCYSQEQSKSKKSLQPIKTLIFPITPPTPIEGDFVLSFPQSSQSCRMEREGLDPDPLKNPYILFL